MKPMFALIVVVLATFVSDAHGRVSQSTAAMPVSIAQAPTITLMTPAPRTAGSHTESSLHPELFGVLGAGAYALVKAGKRRAI